MYLACVNTKIFVTENSRMGKFISHTVIVNSTMRLFLDQHRERKQKQKLAVI